MTIGLVHEVLAGLRGRGIEADCGDDTEIVDRIVRHLATVDRPLNDRLGERADVQAAVRRLRLRAELLAAHANDDAVSALDPLASGLGDAADAYRLAESARLDEFGDPAFALAELDSRSAASLGWTVAAALRSHMPAQAAFDDQVIGAVGDLLEHLAGEDLATKAAAALVEFRAAGAQDRAAMAIAAIEDGWLTLSAAALGALARVEPAVVIRLILYGEPRTIAALVRAAVGGDRTIAATLLLPLAHARNGDENDAVLTAATLLAAYDALDAAAAERVLARELSPVALRSAAAFFDRDVP